MILVYIIFIWLIAMIIYNILTGKKEKERMGKHFNGRFYW